tara:strand:+ start:817 stop:1155 length:339 start_codon:yes stop_codon:yes gene_type:complete
MKITRSALIELISKQIAESDSVLLEGPWEGSSPAVQSDPGESASMEGLQPNSAEEARLALFHLSEQATSLHDMLRGDDSLDKWIQDGIKRSTESLEKVFKAVMYSKQNPEGK